MKINFHLVIIQIINHKNPFLIQIVIIQIQKKKKMNMKKMKKKRVVKIFTTLKFLISGFPDF